ncbi:hypothetical protein GCM10027612_36450 [Microbispora bryophytorum subsp. camponoti]
MYGYWEGSSRGADVIDVGVEEGTVNAAPRIQTTAGRLAALGFADGARAERLLDELGPEAVGDFALLDDIVRAADPDLALTTLSRLVERDASVLGAFRDDPDLRRRVLGVFGLSAALGEHVVRHPECLPSIRSPRWPTLGDLREEMLVAVGADPDAAEPVAEPVTEGSPPGRARQDRRWRRYASPTATACCTWPRAT